MNKGDKRRRKICKKKDRKGGYEKYIEKKEDREEEE